ncbi:transmembrane protein 181-like isoform X5 [Dreissena polymorpha]|uniref:transmembrane protein 181-like isoform X3 n=1 Tax=Dreissena polymorpha TaxID=45954 RepID=UPI002265498D|nr:transmembrane protein 181-like isoform X3 [Dreissena polymorpha]XP_052243618.1 transmembrane protein 181-like isoform X4 [Dreissena polymorpha]XP_052243619.1 transmembrane protein 181-like isoform X5 [Dreissena polymorpha]
MAVAPEIEQSVQMRLYSLNKRQFVMVFVIFFICFGITVLIGIAGPPIIETETYNLSSLGQVESNVNMMTGPFALKSPPMSTFHQQLWLIAHILTDNKQGTRIEQTFTVSVLIGGIKVTEDSLVQSDNPGLDGKAHNRTRLLSCQQECSDLILFHLGYLDYNYYIINVRFEGLVQQTNFNIENIVFYFKSYNTSFTKLEIWLRFTFLTCTFIAACLFSHSLRKFTMQDWSIEQKWMAVLMPLQLLYNDPLFPLRFLVDSWIPGMLDGLFQATFLCALLLFWLCIYHGVRQTDRRFWKFYSLKVLIVGMIWISAVTLSSWQEYNELQDPTYFYRLDTSNFMGFKIFFFIVGGVYLLYLLFLLVRAYTELRSMPYFDLRLKFMTLLMLIVLSISITITVLKFGRAALQDNFVAELSSHYKNSAEFVAFYGLLNIYMFTMAFVYSPTNNAVFETHFKDNPGLSMMNDSDEEVHYGSETESVGMTRVRPAAVGKYDSD